MSQASLFTCRFPNGHGHQWYAPHFGRVPSADLSLLNRLFPQIDTGYAPEDPHQAEGGAALTHVYGWTVLAWWDRSVDLRPNSNTALVIDARYATTTPQTVSTLDGFVLTISGQLGYRIVDLDKLYDTLQQGENAIRSIAQGAIARYIFTHKLFECSPADVESSVAAVLDLEKYGLEYDALQLTTFCRVKTYRLIMDNHENVWEDLLNTQASDIPAWSAK